MTNHVNRLKYPLDSRIKSMHTNIVLHKCNNKIKKAR